MKRLLAAGLALAMYCGLPAPLRGQVPPELPKTTPDTITREQADEMIKELRLIRRLLEADPAPAPAPSAVPVRQPVRGHMTISPDWFAIGRDDAPVTLVEFTDYQCSFCRRFHTETFPGLKEKYIDAGKVRYIARDFPLAFHSFALGAALAARCAGDQGKFWEMREALFAQSADLAPESIKKLGNNLGLDRPRFDQCLDSAKYKPAVEKDIGEAAALAVNGTPGFFIAKSSRGEMTGDQIVGAQPLAAFEHAITQILAASVSAKPPSQPEGSGPKTNF